MSKYPLIQRHVFAISSSAALARLQKDFGPECTLREIAHELEIDEADCAWCQGSGGGEMPARCQMCGGTGRKSA